VTVVAEEQVAERAERAPTANRRARATADGAALRVPVAWLVPGASARAEDPEELAGLTTSIREAGVLEPLLVRELGDELGGPGRRFEIIAGHRRAAAARAAGALSVPVRVVRASDDEAVAFGLAENLCRVGMSERDTVAGVKTLLETYGWNQARVAEYTGKSRGWISEITAVIRAGAAERRAVDAGQVGITTAAKVARLKETDPELHKAYVARLAAGEALRNDDVPAAGVRAPKAPAGVPQGLDDFSAADRGAALRDAQRALPVLTPRAGLEADAARLRVEVLRLVRTVRAALHEQGAGRLPVGLRVDLVTISEEVEALLTTSA
jgi:ParB/RepB/Spo0J family partition protein